MVLSRIQHDIWEGAKSQGEKARNPRCLRRNREGIPVNQRSIKSRRGERLLNKSLRQRQGKVCWRASLAISRGVKHVRTSLDSGRAGKRQIVKHAQLRERRAWGNPNHLKAAPVQKQL